MPHIIVEYSAHLAVDIPNLLNDLHQDLSNRETVDIAAVKTRAIPVEHCVVGAPDDADSFVHITLKLLPGRDAALKTQMANGLFDVASSYVKRPCAITAETLTIEAESYIK